MIGPEETQVCVESHKKQKALTATVITVEDVLTNPKLAIPHYQRPYKWSSRHVLQLIDDIQRFSKKSAYRLGSLVLHENSATSDNGYLYDKKDSLDIVDGQQRTISLVLIVRAFMEHNPRPENQKLLEKFKGIDSKLFNPQLEHPISQRNIWKNYRFVQQRIHTVTEETMLFLLEKCQFVKFVLDDLSVAFQFFDSQNARGMELYPHDLLKAFHLRAFSVKDEKLKEITIEKWENTDTSKLKGVFKYFLFRIKEWSDSRTARDFTKAEVNLFKGFDLDFTHELPFTKIIRMADMYTRIYNNAVDREYDRMHIDFPFQLEMPVVNGRMFFEMVTYYLELSESMWSEVEKHVEKDSNAAKVIHTMNSYDGRGRRGDMYLHQLYDAVLLQYIDKFGYSDIEEVVCHLFIWVYSVRLDKKRVQLATMDNYAYDSTSYLHIIRKALVPKDVISTPYRISIDLNYTKTKDLQTTFKLLLGNNIFNNEHK